MFFGLPTPCWYVSSLMIILVYSLIHPKCADSVQSTQKALHNTWEAALNEENIDASPLKPRVEINSVPTNCRIGTYDGVRYTRSPERTATLSKHRI